MSGAAVDNAMPREKSSSSSVPEYAPVDLDLVPSVDQLLQRLGFGPFMRDQVTAPVGRNEVWAGPTESGTKVFVKRLIGSRSYVAERMHRLLSFERVRAGIPDSAFLTPRLLGTDAEEGLVVFAQLEDTQSGAELMVDQSFDNDLARVTGKAIGLLHAATPDEQGDLATSRPYLPSPELLQGLPPAMFDQLTFAEVETWRLLQHDAPLVEAVAGLCTIEQQAPRVPSHCDLRVDQLLIVAGDLYVTDWEEFRMADPARDVGAFAGEWLYRAVLDIVTSRGDSAYLDVDLTHETVVQRGVQNLERLRPRVEHFWDGYMEAREQVDEGLAERATAFAGWHLLDRLIAGAARSARLSGIERAAAGIGRAALLAPHRFIGTIGLGGQP